MEIKPLLIFPPGWVPYAPYLALPILKGFLEKHSISADIKDVNLEFYDHILSSNFVTKAYRICEDKLESLDKKAEHTEEEKNSYFRYAKAILLKKSIERIDEAKEIIRSSRFYDHDSLETAKIVLLDSLYVIDSAYEEYSINFNDITHKYPINSSEEILSNLDNKLSNIFIEYYETSILEHIKKNNYNLVGFSVTVLSQIKPALTLARMIRKSCPDVRHIVFGGNYITRIALEWNEAHPFFSIFDFLICYEGENALLSLIRSLEGALDLSEVPNLCYIKDGQLIKNGMNPVDINDITVPNFDGFPLNKYFMPKLILPIFTSRCCYSKCAFCTVPSGTYGQYRALKMEDVYRTMGILAEKYGSDYFTFVDETFAPARMRQLSEMIVAGRRDYYWYCETRFEKGLSEEFFDVLYEGGCRKIQFGLESYNQRILDLMKKNIDIANIEPSLVNCLKVGIAFHLFFMVGFPKETAEEAKRTFDFTKNMLDLSWFKYANRNSTRGYGAFGLGRHSYVYDHPVEFAIDIIPNDRKDDLAINCDYIAKEGLSQAEAGRIVSLYNKNLNLVYGGERNYHLLNKMFASEEEHFLKNVLNSGNGGAEKPEAVGRRLALGNYALDSGISLGKSVDIFLFAHNATANATYYEPVATLYNFNTRAYYQLETSYLDIIDKVKRSALSVKNALSYPEAIKEVLTDLLYYGFFDAKTLSQEYAQDYLNMFPVYDTKSVKEACIENHIYLLNVINGKFVKTNKFSLLLLKLMNGSASLGDILETLKKEEIKVDSGELKKMLDEALNKKLVYLKGAPAGS